MARPPPLVAFGICTLIWGTTWFAIKIGYGGLDPIWGAALRFFLASLLMVPLILRRHLPPPLGRRQLGVVFFVGLIMFGADYGLIYWGEQNLPSGLTAILFATMPLFVAVFSGVLIPTDHLTSRHLLGVAIGLGGLAVMFSHDIASGSSAWASMAAIVGSAACAAAAGVVVRRWGKDLDPVVMNASAMMIGATSLAAASLLLGETPSAPATARAWASLLYLVLFGSIVSFLLWWDLLKIWSANRAGLIPVVTPVVAVTTGLLAGEHLSSLQLLGSAIVLAGTALSLVKLPARAPAPLAADVPGGK